NTVYVSLVTVNGENGFAVERKGYARATNLAATLKDMATRREVQRAETISEIRAATLQQIEQDGAAALSLRKVARNIGMSPAGIYRYYENRDALPPDLIADAFVDLGQAVTNSAGADGQAPARLIAAAKGYRDWSFANRNRFSLIFGTPVPGYSAPEDGPTVEAAGELGLAWGRIFAEGVADGSLDVDAFDGAVLEERVAEVVPFLEVTAAGIRAVNTWWAFVHGLVVLEMQRHITWAIADPAAFFTGEIERWLDQVCADAK
ncbi:MAG: TetR/AcrR family transcriptional regulator, partial [Acidimicrobiales bacterium]